MNDKLKLSIENNVIYIDLSDIDNKYELAYKMIEISNKLDGIIKDSDKYDVKFIYDLKSSKDDIYVIGKSMLKGLRKVVEEEAKEKINYLCPNLCPNISTHFGDVSSNDIDIVAGRIKEILTEEIARGIYE